MARDGHIRLLPLHIANKIAAGEVVERPASVVKELVENALDAGAGKIEVSVTAGGRNLVSVRDDGCGMSRADALMSLERQATSKIRDVDDILKIDTLGFRGEAIPSIAAVSRFTMTTRRAADDAATRVQVNAGTLADVREAGAPPGTCVEVRDLFCNVPARRKFLRAYATEEAAIRRAFTINALAHPEVAFVLVCDGREVCRLRKGDTLEDRIQSIFGREFASSLLPVSGSSDSVDVSGYVESPDSIRLAKREQFVFVNGRAASAPVISSALKDAFPRDDSRTRPGAFLFVNLPFSHVDVNVHPAKREVRFHRPAEVRSAIMKAVASIGVCAPERPAAPPVQPLPPSPPRAAPPPAPFSALPRSAAPLQPAPPWPEAAPPRTVPAPVPAPAPQQIPPPAPPPVQPAAELAGKPAGASIRYLAQLSSGVLLFENEAGLVAVSPKAARERILYERILRRSGADPVVSQPLLVPETARMPPAEFAALHSALETVESLGFAIEEFGPNTWKIDAVPAAAGGYPAAEILSSIAQELAENSGKRGGERWLAETAAKACARACSGAAERFTPQSAETLAGELASCAMPYISPSGSPTMILTSNRDFERKFSK